MTTLASIAIGKEAVESIYDLYQAEVSSGVTEFVRHHDLAVTWAKSSPWVDTYDDGDVLAVLDGRLHVPVVDVGIQAQSLVARYREHGEMVGRGLLGDFVFIILDRSEDTVLVARDPLGVRPWYQSTKGRLTAGASDAAALTSLAWVNSGVNESVAIEFLGARTSSRGPTIIEGIRTLPPGETWCWARGRGRYTQHHIWSFETDFDVSWDDAAERCRGLLDQAVSSRLSVDNPVSAQLSGGLDSSSVVGTVARLSPSKLVAERLTFEGDDADESIYSDAVASYWGIPVVSSPAWMPTKEEALELTFKMKRPVPDPNFTMFIGLDRTQAQLGRSYMLTGLGGDDAFVAASAATRVLAVASFNGPPDRGSMIRSIVISPRAGWHHFVRPTLHYVAPWKGPRLPFWVSERAALLAKLRDLLHKHPPKVTGVAAVDERISNITTGYDAAILESRALVADETGRRESHPFLDPRFVEGTYGLNPWWPTRGGHTRALQVEAFKDRLPPSVAARRSKVEFSGVFWPQLLDEVELAAVRSGPLTALGWLDQNGFDRLVMSARQGMANYAIPLSRCVALDRWLRSRG
jgi:asparagine synthase (glutamine-hydrolysing)